MNHQASAKIARIRCICWKEKQICHQHSLCCIGEKNRSTVVEFHLLYLCVTFHKLQSIVASWHRCWNHARFIGLAVFLLSCQFVQTLFYKMRALVLASLKGQLHSRDSNSKDHRPLWLARQCRMVWYVAQFLFFCIFNVPTMSILTDCLSNIYRECVPARSLRFTASRGERSHNIITQTRCQETPRHKNCLRAVIIEVERMTDHCAFSQPLISCPGPVELLSQRQYIFLPTLTPPPPPGLQLKHDEIAGLDVPLDVL